MATARSAPGWVMLDRFVFRRDDDDDDADATPPFPDESRASLRASSCTSDGKSFDVAFLPAEPPAISRLYVRWPGGTTPEDGKGTDLVAAHRGLLLFRLASIEKLDTPPYLLHTQDHFILRASSFPGPAGPPRLQLKRLPVCTRPLVLLPDPGHDSEEEEEAEGEDEEEEKEIVMQRVFFPDTVGLIRSLGRNSEEFAVAQLSTVSPIPGSSRTMEAEVCVLRSRVSAADGDGGGTWEVEKIPIQHEKYEFMDLYHWSTDDVISFKNRICWVSYRRGGILFYDALQERPKITYLRLPINDRPYSSSECQAFNDNRAVCVTSGGDVLRFIDVTRSDRTLYVTIRRRFSFHISSHTLRTRESGEMDWSWDERITSHELWAHSTHLPREALMFPLVSMEEPHVVHFMVSEKRDEIHRVSVVTVDILTKTVSSIVPYIRGEEDLCGEDADLVREKSHLLKSFLPCDFFPSDAADLMLKEDEVINHVSTNVTSPEKTKEDTFSVSY